ncbi:hypothetical protein [Streptomyces sp. MP131-18]|uniref:hypothetical protein n=1 Tax=Streptomyces sp. MP131-18 TaxID=1857892 RepID=UPI00097C73C6|nr:hypothetical protein [Streptomyces sp. MP131-18]ONK13243.1 hypothetical protein STBA_40060 [Streptomyces sp. MP131-18]
MNRYVVTITARVGDLPVEMTMRLDEESEHRAETLAREAFRALLERPIGNWAIESATVRDGRPRWQVDVPYHRSGQDEMAIATFVLHAEDEQAAQAEALIRFQQTHTGLGCLPGQTNVVPA